MTFAFDNTYVRLPARFFAPVSPTPVRSPRVVKVNRALAERLGVEPDDLASPQGAQILAGNVVPRGAEPIALAYAGHQFGSFVPLLGDGRAILLGEIIAKDGGRFDVQLKGSGRTPFSRQGDGRAALGPVLREYVVSEAMAALGVPTTRALGAVTTGETVLREESLPGAVLTRVARSHIRVGTFELFAARADREALTTLVSYALRRHYPDAVHEGNGALALFERVVRAHAELVARWLGVGFVHGVMNTDNSAISGETIDYGPCAFLDEYDPNKTFSAIDRGGRYAFGSQPRIAQWNLARFGETLLPLFADEEDVAVGLATERLQQFSTLFAAAHARVLRAKLGLATEDAHDPALAADLLARMASNGVDHTVLFRRLCAAAADPAEDARIAELFADQGAFGEWACAWRQRLGRENVAPDARVTAMRHANPAFIPRNHRLAQAIEAAVQGDDFGPFETLVRVLGRPYEEQPEFAHLAEPPRPQERVLRTFCGT
jgi:serine/tyrosine/threonine adenylyltransferase